MLLAFCDTHLTLRVTLLALAMTLRRFCDRHLTLRVTLLAVAVTVPVTRRAYALGGGGGGGPRGCGAGVWNGSSE